MWSGERIRQLRLKLGWSKAAFSRRLGCSFEALERLESNEVNCDGDTLRQLEVLSFHLDSYNDVLSRSSQADPQLDAAGKTQIHKKDLK